MRAGTHVRLVPSGLFRRLLLEHVEKQAVQHFRVVHGI
jgi:hypothetical protein